MIQFNQYFSDGLEPPTRQGQSYSKAHFWSSLSLGVNLDNVV